MTDTEIRMQLAEYLYESARFSFGGDKSFAEVTEVAKLSGLELDEFWTKHVLYLEGKGIVEVESNSVKRATLTSLGHQLFVDEKLEPHFGGEIATKQEQRHRLLRNIYYLAENDVNKAVSLSKAIEGMGIFLKDAHSLLGYLENEGLAVDYAQSGDESALMITHSGIKQVEASPEPLKTPPIRTDKTSRKIFIVHGHDREALVTVARFLEKLDLKPIILHEAPNKGMTVIEKFEKHADVPFAVVLLTPDDMAYAKNEKPELAKPRCRQNVMLELGYFMGKLDRKNVCALVKEGVEIPSDYHGVVFIKMGSNGGWRLSLAREIKESGIDVDLNKSM